MNPASKISIVAIILCSAIHAATTLPPNFQETELCNGILTPICLEIVPDGRFFVCEQSGKVRVVKNGALLGAPLLALTVDSNGMRGLLAVAVDPNFATNNYFYVLYTAPATSTTGAQNILSRFTANGDTADPATELQLFKLDPFGTETDHCDASLAIGPDGKFYIGTSDNLNFGAAQSNSSMLGKMLRLNMDGSIPSDNPFVGSAQGNYQAIWALGLRQPYTMSFQPGTGRMFINDVDSQTWEEINEGKAGANYGWPQVTGHAGAPAYVDPFYSYPYGRNSLTAGCAITGGAFYNPATNQFPNAYAGSYFFMDYLNGWIQRIDLNNGNTVSLFASNMQADIVQLKVGIDGSLYYVFRGTGALRRISYIPGTPPSITQQPADQSVYAGLPASFSVTAAGSAPLSYQWQRNGSDISGATAATYTLNPTALSDDGATFHCNVSNSYGGTTSNDATLHVTPRQPPTASIDTPISGALYSAGQPIAFAGSASDTVDGPLPNSAYTWQIDQFENGQSQPAMPAASGMSSGAWTPPDSGDAATDFFYRITLTVVNSGGQTTTVSRDVLPRIVTLHFRTVPPGLAYSFDGAVYSVGLDMDSVVGFQHTVAIDAVQALNGVAYGFVSWSDQGGAAHTLIAPAQESTYTATFSAQDAPPAPAAPPQTPGPPPATPGAPVISGPIAAPAAPLAGDSVIFSADASGAGPLAWLWDFGDGSGSIETGAASHAFANAGNYTVTLTVTDANGLSSTAFAALTVQPVYALTVTRFSASLNFKTAGRDTCNLAATMTVAPFNLSGVPVTVAIGGMNCSFVAGKNGGATANHARLALRFQKPNGPATQLRLSLAIANANCAAAWAAQGLNLKMPASALQMPVSVTVGTQVFRTTLTCRFSGAKMGAGRLSN